MIRLPFVPFSLSSASTVTARPAYNAQHNILFDNMLLHYLFAAALPYVTANAAHDAYLGLLTLVKPLRRRRAERGADRFRLEHVESGSGKCPRVHLVCRNAVNGWEQKRTKPELLLVRL